MTDYTVNSENLYYFNSADGLAKGFLDFFKSTIKETLSEKDIINIAMSGGSSPEKFFTLLPNEDINWDRINIFWVDERCVPAEHPESNFGKAKKLFIDKINIPPANIHNIRGDNDLIPEIQRYGSEIINNVADLKFDFILLGAGNDGHTASLFPGQELVENYMDVCGISKHPQTGQNRITLTYKTICASGKISFLVSGQDKKEILNEILINNNGFLPAGKVNKCASDVNWFTDIEL